MLLAQCADELCVREGSVDDAIDTGCGSEVFIRERVAKEGRQSPIWVGSFDIGRKTCCEPGQRYCQVRIVTINGSEPPTRPVAPKSRTEGMMLDLRTRLDFWRL